MQITITRDGVYRDLDGNPAKLSVGDQLEANSEYASLLIATDCAKSSEEETAQPEIDLKT